MQKLLEINNKNHIFAEEKEGNKSMYQIYQKAIEKIALSKDGGQHI